MGLKLGRPEMPLSGDAHRILDAFKDAGVPVGQWLDDRLIRTAVPTDTSRSSALWELADAGYIRIHDDNEQLALTDLGNDVINSETISRQNWKPWRPSSDRG
jgi:hypothetical protein